MPDLTLLAGAAVGLLYGGLCLATGAGGLRLIDRWQRGQPPLRPLARAAMAFALGHAILGTLWLLVALAGVFTLVVVGAIAAGIGALTIRHGVTVFRDGWRAGREVCFAPGAGGLLRAAWALIALASLLFLARALLPPRIDDALQIYLVTPMVVAAEGHFEFRPYNHHLVYPVLSEMNLAATLLFGNETAATTLDALAGVALLAAMLALAREAGVGVSGAFFAPFLLLTSLSLTCLIGTGKVDTTGALHVVAAFFFACRTRHGQGGDSLLTGIFTGAALATKYTNAVLPPAVAVILLAVVPWGASRPAAGVLVRRAALVTLGGCLIFGPQMLKNVLLVGNPVAPMMATWFGTDSAWWTALIAQEYRIIGRLSGLLLWAWPLTLTFSPQISTLGGLSPLYLGLLPAVGWVGAGGRLSKILAVAGGVSILTWWAIDFPPITPRYIYPALIAFAVTAAAVAGRLLERPIVRPALLACTVALSGLMLVQLREVALAARYLFGVYERDHIYLSNSFQAPHYEAARFLREHHRSGERVFLEGIEYPYFLGPEILSDSQSAAEGQSSSGGCADRDTVIREGGFTWVAVRTVPGGNPYITARLGYTTCENPPGYEVAFTSGFLQVLRATGGG